MTKNLQYELNKHSNWNNDLCALNTNPLIFCKTTHDKQDYIGFYLEERHYTQGELSQLEKQLIDSLLQVCPEFNATQLKLCLFSQLFIG